MCTIHKRIYINALEGEAHSNPNEKLSIDIDDCFKHKSDSPGSVITLKYEHKNVQICTKKKKK